MPCPALVEKKYSQCATVLGKKHSCQVHSASQGWFLHCEHGVVVLAPNSPEAFEVHGEIFLRYQEIGFNRLGFPLSDELPAADGLGRYSKFEKGYIYWSPTTGAWEIKGEIYQKWKEFKGEIGFLGYPVSDQKHSTQTNNGIAKYNDFQHGSIYDHPHSSRGAYEIHGAIREYWNAKGREQSVFGLPITDEVTPNFNKDARCSFFDRYTLFWYPNIGVQESHSVLDDSNFFSSPIPIGDKEQNRLNAFRMLHFIKDKKNHISFYRRKVAALALQEVVDGHSGEDAADRYNAEIIGINKPWCSEFVRWVFRRSMAFKNEIIEAYIVSAMTNVSGCKLFFKNMQKVRKIKDKLWYNKHETRPDTAQIGDYISVNNGEHSALIVAVSSDKQWLHTAEGNVGDSTYFSKHNYFHKENGYHLNSEIYGIGKIHRKLFSDIVSNEY